MGGQAQLGQAMGRGIGSALDMQGVRGAGRGDTQGPRTCCQGAPPVGVDLFLGYARKNDSLRWQHPGGGHRARRPYIPWCSGHGPSPRVLQKAF